MSSRLSCRYDADDLYEWVSKPTDFLLKLYLSCQVYPVPYIWLCNEAESIYRVKMTPCPWKRLLWITLDNWWLLWRETGLVLAAAFTFSRSTGPFSIDTHTHTIYTQFIVCSKYSEVHHIQYTQALPKNYNISLFSVKK